MLLSGLKFNPKERISLAHLYEKCIETLEDETVLPEAMAEEVENQLQNGEDNELQELFLLNVKRRMSEV